MPSNDLGAIINFTLLSGEEALCTWSVHGVSYPNRSQMLFMDPWVHEVLWRGAERSQLFSKSSFVPGVAILWVKFAGILGQIEAVV